MTDFLEFVATLAVLISMGALPALATSKMFSTTVGWVTLGITALLPFVVAELELVNPAFGGWIVIAIPYWAGSFVAFFFLAAKLRGSPTADREKA